MLLMVSMEFITICILAVLVISIINDATSTIQYMLYRYIVVTDYENVLFADYHNAYVIAAIALFILLVDRVGGVAAPELLHTALDGVFGVFPVGVPVAVVEFFHKPGNVLTHALHVALHQVEQKREESVFLLVVQLVVRFGADVSEMVEA